VRSCIGLRNVYALMTTVFYFVSAVLGPRTKLKELFERVCDQAKRFYGIATFFHYAVAAGFAACSLPPPRVRTCPPNPSSRFSSACPSPHPTAEAHGKTPDLLASLTDPPNATTIRFLTSGRLPRMWVPALAQCLAADALSSLQKGASV